MDRYNEKRDLVRKEMGSLLTDAELISKFATLYGPMDEDQASAEIQELLLEDRAKSEEFADSSAQRFHALGRMFLAQMQAESAWGPAAQMYKILQSQMGLDQPQQVQVELSAAPSAQIVRQRIADLLASQPVQQQARVIDVDLDELASEHAPYALPQRDQNVLDVGDGLSKAVLLNRQMRGDQADPSEPSAPSDPGDEPDPRDRTDPPANLLAEHLTRLR